MNPRNAPNVETIGAPATVPAVTGPVVFVIELRVRPGLENELLALVEPVLDAMRHEATFINAVLHRDPEDPGRFMLYETWADLTDVIEVQLGRDYRQAYMERLPELLTTEREVRIWAPLRSDFAR